MKKKKKKEKKEKKKEMKENEQRYPCFALEQGSNRKRLYWSRESVSDTIVIERVFQTNSALYGTRELNGLRKQPGGPQRKLEGPLRKLEAPSASWKGLRGRSETSEEA